MNFGAHHRRFREGAVAGGAVPAVAELVLPVFVLDAHAPETRRLGAEQRAGVPHHLRVEVRLGGGLRAEFVLALGGDEVGIAFETRGAAWPPECSRTRSASDARCVVAAQLGR